jgi:ABC-type transporter Mla MlaB component
MKQRRKAGSASKKRVARPGGATSFALAADCTVSQAVRLKSRLAAFLVRPSNLTLNARAVKRVDGAGLQLLAAFVRQRRASGRSVTWRGVSSELAEGAALLGLAAILELPEQRA